MCRGWMAGAEAATSSRAAAAAAAEGAEAAAAADAAAAVAMVCSLRIFERERNALNSLSISAD